MGKNKISDESEEIVKQKLDKSKRTDPHDSLFYHLKIIIAKNKMKIVSGILILVILIGIIFIILFGTVPCRFKTCNPNASCVNRPFNAKCQCNHGYNGNGIDCDECGLAYYDTSQRQRGGRAVDHSRPATAFISLGYYKIIQVDGSHFITYFSTNCGGVLINRMTILTAASCLPTNHTWFERSNNKSYNVDITLNSYFPNYQSIYGVYIGLVFAPAPDIDLSTMQQLYIDKIIKHENYDPNLNGYDLAIIKLRNKVILDEYVQVACIPDSYEAQFERTFLTVNQTAFSTGWGRPFGGRNGGQYQALNNYEMNIFNNSYCADILRSKGDIGGIFCAGNYTNYIGRFSDSYCRGNQGGGLYASETINGKLKDMVIGILSYNYLCGLQVFTNLFHYIDWVADKSDY